MPELPYFYAHVSRDLRGYARDVCTRMQKLLDQEGHVTSGWRFDAQHQPSLETAVQVIIEFVYERGPERKRIWFLGPTFVGKPTTMPADLAAAMKPEVVRDWLRSVYDCREALSSLMSSRDSLGSGIVDWSCFGHQSDVMCVLDGVPVPKVIDFPIEDVLPKRCFVHLVDGGTGEAKRSAGKVAKSMVSHGHRVTWIDPEGTWPRREGADGGSVERAQHMIMASLSATDALGKPAPPSLIVLVRPDTLPTEKEAAFPDARVQPETAIMWANFLRNLILRDTTVLIVSTVPDVAAYPNSLPALLEPWRAIAKFERVYRSSR